MYMSASPAPRVCVRLCHSRTFFDSDTTVTYLAVGAHSVKAKYTHCVDGRGFWELWVMESLSFPKSEETLQEVWRQ